jgi:hypothetical protein
VYFQVRRVQGRSDIKLESQGELWGRRILSGIVVVSVAVERVDFGK